MWQPKAVKSNRQGPISFQRFRLTVLLAGVVTTLASCSYSITNNSLAVGKETDPDGPIDVPINQPCNLNFLTKNEIIALRTAAIQRFPQLLRTEYSPTHAIFDQIVDKRPWWGLQGTFIWGPGDRSIEGPAEESRFLVNPYLIVGANSGTCLIWDKDKILDAELKDESFPYCWIPDKLRMYPKQALVQISYDVTRFNEELTARKSKLALPVEQTNKFGLVAYNARDFGYNFIYLDKSKSLNITPAKPADHPILIKQMIHCGNSCKYPGGCNNMSPAQPEIDEFDISSLPARANIRLWKNLPVRKDTPADLTLYIDFR